MEQCVIAVPVQLPRITEPYKDAQTSLGGWVGLDGQDACTYLIMSGKGLSSYCHC